MGDWLEGNKMRTQSALQARQMANQTQQKGFENMMTSMGTVQKSFEPAALKNLEVEKERELYGPDGIRTGYETGQKELQAKIASEANIKSFQAAYPGEEAFEWVGEGPNRTKKPSRAYMMYTFGFDPNLQWGRYEMDRDKQYGQMTDVLRSSFNYIRDQMGPSIVVDPETGKLQGLDGERKKDFIDHIAQSLWDNNNRGRWGIKTWEQAKRKAAEWVDGAVWTGMDTVGADMQGDEPDADGFSNTLKAFDFVQGDFLKGLDQYKHPSISNKINSLDMIADLAADIEDLPTKQSVIKELEATRSEWQSKAQENSKEDINKASDKLLRSINSLTKTLKDNGITFSHRQYDKNELTNYGKSRLQEAAKAQYGIPAESIPDGATYDDVNNAIIQLAINKFGASRGITINEAKKKLESARYMNRSRVADLLKNEIKLLIKSQVNLRTVTSGDRSGFNMPDEEDY